MGAVAANATPATNRAIYSLVVLASLKQLNENTNADVSVATATDKTAWLLHIMRFNYLPILLGL